MEIYTGSGQKLTLTQADFAGSGAFGAVYVRGGLAYKVFADPALVIPEGKMRELRVLDRPEILRPLEFVFDAAGQRVGFVMHAVANGLPLSRVFTRTFRDRRQLTPDLVLGLVVAMRQGVQYVHEKGITIVDLNENNFLVDDLFQRIYFIDVDSYQTPSFPATAISDSVRDRHAKSFDAMSDWFSFAVVSFQLFTGMHPYRGTCPGFKGLDDRMLANVSVFNPKVTLPSACLPLDVIPDAYRSWYAAVLERGMRCAAPETASTVLVVRSPTTQRRSGRSAFIVELLREFPADILDYLNGAVLTSEGVSVGAYTWPERRVVLGVVPRHNTPVAARVCQGRLRLYDLLRGHEIAADIACDEVAACEGRLYAKRGGSLFELCFTGMPAGTLVTTRLASTVPNLSTHLFPGAALLDLLGSWYASLFAGRGAAPQVRLKELDGSRVIDARYMNRVLMVTATRDGRADKYIYRFTDTFGSQDVRVVHNVSVTGVNFTVLDTGVCLHMTHEDQLEVFANSPSDKIVNLYQDPALDGISTLFKNGAQALFARGRCLYKFSMPAT